MLGNPAKAGGSNLNVLAGRAETSAKGVIDPSRIAGLAALICDALRMPTLI